MAPESPRHAATRSAGRRGEGATAKGTRSFGLPAILAALLSVLGSTSVSATPIADPIGDAISGAYMTYDISPIDATFDSTTLTFTIGLTSTPIAPSANQLTGLSGFIDIDVDSNPGTGATANIDTIGGSFGSTGLSIEYYLDLFTEQASPGFVTLKDPINVMNTSQVPITYGASSATIAVPLSSLGNDDGLVNYAVGVGDFGNATDQALDPSVVQQGGLPASSTLVPQPSTGLLLGTGLGLLACTARRPQRTT
jgi:hypothetical protein